MSWAGGAHRGRRCGWNVSRAEPRQEVAVSVAPLECTGDFVDCFSVLESLSPSDCLPPLIHLLHVYPLTMCDVADVAGLKGHPGSHGLCKVCRVLQGHP